MLSMRQLSDILARFTLVAAVLFAPCTQAGSITLAWDASTSPSVTGYKLYFGASSRTYGTPVNLGNASTYTLSGLQDGQTYFFAVTAVDSAGKESAFSNEISKALPPPIIANFTAAPVAGTVPLNVVFTNTSSNAPAATTWLWDFGDYAKSTEKSPTHSYTRVGNYTVKLTATATGVPSGSVTKLSFITVSSVSTPPGGGAGSPPPPTSTTGLVAAYAFHEGSGSILVDASGNGNHGRITGARQLIYGGRFDNALLFNGTNNWVTAANATSLNMSNALSIEAWVYPQTDMKGWRSIVAKEMANGTRNYFLAANDGDSDQPSTGVFTGGKMARLAGGPWLLKNQWTHLAATYDGVNQRLYINGQQVASRPQTGPIRLSDGVLHIGASSLASDRFAGRIDELRIYNRALTQKEIQGDLSTAITLTPGTRPKQLLGNGRIEGSSYSSPAGTAQAFPFTATTSGYAVHLRIHIGSLSAATQRIVGIYTDNNGHPGSLLAQASIAVNGNGWRWAFLPATELKAGQKYWIAVLGVGGELQYAGGSTGVSESSGVAGNNLPSTWVTGEVENKGPLSGFALGW